MDKAAFTEGFIEGLAEEGYTPSDLEDGLEKMAFGIWPMLGTAGIAALIALSGARFVARAGGRGMAKITEPSEEDIEAAKREEILAKYKTLTGEATRRALELEAPMAPSA